MSDYLPTMERRLKTAGAVVIVVAAVFVWRMFNIQIIQHGHYQDLAFGQQRFEKTEIAQRGIIYVHDSQIDSNKYYPLAFDVKKFAVWVVPRNVIDKEKTASILSSMLSIPGDEIFSLINNNKLYIPPIKKGLGYDQANEIKEQQISGVFVMPEYNRFYSENLLGAHILGFVNGEGKGQYGFEGHYDNELTGTAGNITGEKDTLGRVISLLDQKNPQDGTSYVLTIDRSVQYFVEKKLAEALQTHQATSGTVVIMDIKTGGIVAMASNPSFDPNNFKDYAESKSELFINPAISHLYEPGSVLKPIVMSSALDSGGLKLEDEGDFDWHVWVDGYEIKTAERKPFGHQNLTQILQNSDNVAMVWVSEKLGKDNLYKYLKSFNMFDKTGVDLDTEATGYAPEFKYWKDINRSTIAFGQGISITPIELLGGYATIANNGRYIYPHIVDKMIFADGSEKKVEPQEGEQVIKKEVANEMARMLTAVVDNGHAKRAAVAGFEVAGKTGTAQISKTGGGYEESEDGLGIFNHTLAGFAPANEPRFAMIVKLERPKAAKYAESTAAPLFGDIANFLLNYHYRLMPSR